MSRRKSPEEGRRLRLLITADYLNRLSLLPLNLKQTKNIRRRRNNMIEINGVKYKDPLETIDELKIENFELRNTIKLLLDYIKQENK